MIDAHHHLWDPAAAEYRWMTDQMAQIRRRFGPEDLQPLLETCGVTHSVWVQARQDLEETRHYLATARQSGFIVGVVGWADLTSPYLPAVVDELRAGPGGDRLVGLRHMVQDEPDPDWLRRDAVQRGIAELGRLGLAYDILIKPPQLPAALETARALPAVRLVIDHLAKPPIASGETAAWAALMEPFADLAHVSCKLSGMVTEAAPDWRAADLEPYVRHAWEWFGEDRLLFGSDWPVCLLAASYRNVFEALEEVLGSMGVLTETVRGKVFGENAAKFYQLKVKV